MWLHLVQLQWKTFCSFVLFIKNSLSLKMVNSISITLREIKWWNTHKKEFLIIVIVLKCKWNFLKSVMVNYCTIFYQSIIVHLVWHKPSFTDKKYRKNMDSFFRNWELFLYIKLLILWSNWYYFYYNFFETSSLLTKNVSEFRFLELKWDCDGYLVSTVYLFKKIRSMHLVNKHITVNLH